MIENSNLSKNAKRLTVRVKSLKAEGSGIIYFPQNNTEELYIITAKHCICGEDFSVISPKSEDIEIEYFNEKRQGYDTYNFSQDDKLLYFENNVKDIALLIVDKEPFKEALSAIEPFQLIDNEKGIRNSGLFGFPKGSHDEDLERVDTRLQLPTNSFVWKAEPQRPIQSEKYTTTLGSTKGFSGSGFFLNTQKEFLLLEL